MKLLKRVTVVLLALLALAVPAFSTAESDYEEGDGWFYRDGELKITSNEGLINFLYHEYDMRGDPQHKHSAEDVNRTVIGKEVTDIEIDYFIGDYHPSSTSIEEGNPCFIIDQGWVINKETMTLFGAANVKQNVTASVIDNIPPYIEHIGMFAFSDCSVLKTILLPKGIVSIGESSFDGCDSLKSINLPKGITTIDIAAFSGCSNLTQISFGDEINYIGAAAFDACIHLEPPPFYNMQLDTIYGNSFWGCDTFQTVEFSPSLRLVENQAFAHCSKLTSLIFNSDQLILENGAFDACENVRKLVFTQGTPISIGRSLFGEDERTPDGKSFITRLYDPNGKVIPYPTLYYTADYAAAWAPNGETEWNGYPIQQISQEELDAILKEARGEEAPIVSASPVPTETQQTETSAPDESDSKPALVIGIRSILCFEVCIVAIVFVVIAILRSRKGKK